MDPTRFDAFARALGDEAKDAPSRRSVLALFSGGLAAAVLTPSLAAEARGKKKRGKHGKGRKCKGKNKNKPKCRGGSGGGLGLMELCDQGTDTCQSGLTCDTPTTRHNCSSTVEGVDSWCCVPPGGKCTGCECCGDYYCDFGDANPDGACIPNPEG